MSRSGTWRAAYAVSRTLCALFVMLLAATALASAAIQVNKAFSPNSIALGGNSTVTVTLQNDSTASAAAITAFSDDIATMSGHATLLSSPAPSSTCAGGTPTVSGQVVSMNDGTIPKAPNASTLGSCTLTFTVVGAVIGNGFNTISASNVVTSLGSPSADVTQTLSVRSVNVTASPSPTSATSASVQAGDTSTITYAITNPASVPLTNAAFPIAANSAASFTLTSFTSNCGGTATLPAAGTSGTANFSGLTIPASPATCTVTLNVTTPSVTTVNFTLSANGITDDQGATNSTGYSAQAKFVNGVPNITKAFNPTAIAPGTTTVLTIRVANVLTDKPLTNAAFTDVLPANLTLAATPTASAACGSPTLGTTGSATLSFSGGTIATNGTCTVTATVSMPSSQATGPLTNTIPTTSFTSNEANGSAAAATATLQATAPGGGISTSKTALPTSVGVNSPTLITLRFTSLAGGAFTGGTFTDTLPQTPQPMIALTDAGHQPAFTSCGASPAITFGGTGGNTSVTGSNLAITSGGTCTVTFYAAFSTTTSANRVDTNQLTNTNVSFTGTNGTVNPTQSVSATITELPTLSISNYVASATGPLNQNLTVAASINDASATADTNAVAVINLTPGKVALATTPNFTFNNCPAGLSAANIVVAGNREQFTVTIGAISATCTIGYDVINETQTVGTSYVPANPTYSSALTGNVPIASTGQNSVTFATTTVNVTKSFTPNQIQSGGNSTADILLGAPQAGALARTQVNGIAFSDALPANVTFSPTPNVSFSAGCAQNAQPAPAFSIRGETISFTNISLLTVGTTQTTCDVRFDVTSSVVGAPLNQIGAGAITSTSGTTNTQVAKASLTVNAGLGIAKTFVNPTLQIGGTDYVRFLVTNSASSSTLGNGTLVDAMPSSLVLASTVLGAQQNGDPALCGGSVSGPVGTSTLNVSGIGVAGYTSASAPGQCVIYVQVKASASAAPGSVTNTVAAGGLNLGGFSNQGPATGTLTLSAPPAPSVAKSFAPAAIASGGSTLLSIGLANTASGAADLSGLALTDALPSGLTIAATPNAATTCGAGTVTAAAGGTSVALTGGAVAATASCTISVNVTGSSVGSYTNTIPASSLTTTQGATNASAANANLTVGSVTVAKAFAPATIPAGGNSTLTITIPNTAAGSVSLSGMALSDALPAGVTLAATPNAATTCGAGTVTAVAGGATLALTGGSVAANATCTLSASVTASAAAAYTNTISTGALTTTQGVSNPTPATANLTVRPSNITLAKAFAPATITAGGTSLLTITIPNTAAGSVPLSGMSLSDALPAGLTIAATPNAATTCGAGMITASAGGASVALANGSIAANATCTITVSVTGTAVGSYTNTLPVGALTTTQTASNSAPANASLSIVAPNVTLVKAFAPAATVPGATSLLTLTIDNTASSSVALGGLSLSDTYPAGLVNATTPAAATTCAAGSVTAVSGSGSLTLAGGTLAAGASCTVSVNVSAPLGNYTNTIAAGALTTTQGATNAAGASAGFSVATAPNIVLGTAFAPASISPNAISSLTITLANMGSGSVALSNLNVSDALPAGVSIAAVPNGTSTCGAGAVTATAAGTNVALAGGTLAAGATCTLSVNVTGAVPNTYTNTIPAGNVTSTQGASNPGAATATLTIVTPGAVGLSKAFMPASIAVGGTSVLTITVANVAEGSVALSDMAFSDSLPTGVTVASVPNASTTCQAGVVTAAAAGTNVGLGGARLASGASCTVVVSVTGTTPGAYTNTIPARTLTSNETGTNSGPASATLTILAPNVTLTKSFVPASIAPGATSLLTLTIHNTAPASLALSGLALSDAYPVGLVNAATPGALTTCPSGTVTAVATSASLTLAGGTLASGASCTVSVNVDAPLGAYPNGIAAGALTSTQGATNAAAANAELTVAAAPNLALSMAFAPTSIASNANATLTITLANTGTGNVALSGLGLSDTLPAGLRIAAVPAATTTCGAGTVTAAAAATSVSLSAGTLAAGGTCTLSVSVTGTTPNAYADTIAAGNVTSTQGASNTTPASATLTISAPNVLLTKTFAPASIVRGAASLLTLTIVNTSPSSVALSGLTLSDAYPAGLVNAATPNAATTCPAGTLTAIAGGTSLSLAGGTLAAAASCAVSVDVSGPAGTYSNSIAAGALTTTQGASNAAAATAALSVLPPSPPTVSNAFLPLSIAVGAVSKLTVTIANTGANAVALENLALHDALPAGLVLAPVPNASTTCPSGVAPGTAGGTSLTLGGASLASGATCTLSADVTSAVVATYTNTISASALSDTQALTNVVPASTTLSVVGARTLTLAKAFAPASIVSGGTSILTVTIANASAGAIALTSLALSDALPAGVVVAAQPISATTCGTGAVTAAARATSFALNAGTLAAGATCTFSVSVTSAVAGSHLDTSAAGAVTDAQNVSNPTPAGASLAVVAAPAISLAQSFAPATIPAAATSVLTISLHNTATSAVALGSVALTDVLPAGVALAGAPNASTTCPAGVVRATAAAATFALSGATLAANATCTITVTVTAGAAGVYENAISAAAITSAQGATNATDTQATLNVTSAGVLGVTKTSDVNGAGVRAGQTIAYSIAIRNSGSSAETGAKITDVLTNARLVPGSVRVNGARAADSVVTAAATFGSLAAGATVTIAYAASVNANAPSGASVTNSASAGGDQGCSGTGCSGNSPPDIVSPPKLAVTLLIDGQTNVLVTLGQVVTYSATVKNIGGSMAQNVRLDDKLPAGVTPLPGSITTSPPLAGSEQRSLSYAATRSASNGTISGQTVTASLENLAPGASATMTVRANVSAPIRGFVANIVTVGATGIPGAVTSNIVVARMLAATLNVTKTTGASVVESGDRIDYVVHVAAPAGSAFGSTTIVDRLPDYLLFAPGTARVNGISNDPAVRGHSLIWTIPALSGPIALTYATTVAPGAPANTTLDNLVTVSSAALGAGPAGSGSASASVQVAASAFGNCYPITGRVYDDLKHTGDFEHGDAGLGGVRIVLDDGESALTDAFGRYDFPCVRPGMHALRLDEQTLPSGNVAYADRAIDSERSTRRLVHSTFDSTILQDINFAVTQRKQ